MARGLLPQDKLAYRHKVEKLKLILRNITTKQIGISLKFYEDSCSILFPFPAEQILPKRDFIL
jgi:hypothetical protein